MPFIRVKSPTTGHEFDVTPNRVDDHPEWVLVDAEPVDEARPPKYGKPAKVKTVEPSTEQAPALPTEAPRFTQRSAPSGD